MQSRVSHLEVRLEHVQCQATPVRPGEPAWAGPGYDVFEELPGGSLYVGFVPEAALAAVVEDYSTRMINVRVGEPTRP